MSFVPSFFGKFGRPTNDLLNTKFEAGKNDFRHGASIKTQANGVTIKSTGTAIDDNKLSATVNVAHADKQYGNSSFELDTAGKAKTTVRLTKLTPGFALQKELEFTTSDPCSSIGGKVVAEYSQANIAANAEYVSKKNTLLTAAVYGQNGISGGVSVTTDLKALSSGSFDPSKDIKPQVGMTYEDGNINFSAVVDSDKNTNFTAFHRVSPDFQIASKYTTGSKQTALAVGGQYKINASTSFKAKATINNDGAHAYYGYLSHSMANPNVIVGVSASYNSEKASAVGVKLAFGEY